MNYEQALFLQQEIILILKPSQILALQLIVFTKLFFKIQKYKENSTKDKNKAINALKIQTNYNNSCMNSNFIILITLLVFALTTPAQAQCISPCKTCVTGAAYNCTSCVSQYTMSTNAMCVPVSCTIPYCSICLLSTQSMCVACLPTFVLFNGTYTTSCVCQTGFAPSPYGSPTATCVCNSTNCTSCPIPGCLTCQTGTTCSSCAIGYVMTTGSNLCIACNVTACQTCLVNNFCMTCTATYNATLNGYCAYCSSNCLNCLPNSTICGLCAPGYSPTKYPNSCLIPCNVPYCLICSDTNICKQCAYGYIVYSVTNACVSNVSPAPFPFPCIGYYYTGGFSSNPYVCTTCNQNYFQQYSNNNMCYNCDVPNCLSCDPNNISQCITCLSNYRNYGNTCVIYVAQNCSQKSADLTQCVTCNNYYTSINGICYPCTTPACLVCSSNNTAVCLTCKTGTYLSGFSCSPCQPYCVACTNSSSCTQLSLNAMLVNSQYYYTVCAANCLVCSPQNPASCSSCAPGFYYSTYLSMGLCLPCNPSSNCLNCSNTNPSQCLSCLNLGYLVTVNGTIVCQYCTSPCSSCMINSTTTCISCISGYYLNGTQCILNTCSPNCLYCGSNNTCLVCTSGYFPYQGNGTCLPGLPACIKASPLHPFTCQNCAPGNGLNSYTSTCFQCPLNCLFCSSPLVCLTCQSGYNLTTDSFYQCVPYCSVPCATCSLTDPSQCLSCIAGYTFNSGTCSPITNCLSCLVCPIGYSFSTTLTCIACGPTCASCTAASPNNCTGCLTGQWLNGTLCVSCPASCASCINPNSCNYCQPGFYRSPWSPTALVTSGINTCLPCQSPCMTCTNLNSLCLSCISGYSLLGNQCVNDYNYQFNIVFNATTTSFNLAYPNIVQSLLSALGTQDQSKLSVTTYLYNENASLYSGQLSSICNPQNTSCVTNQQNNVNSVISSPNIGGLSVVSSKMTPSNGNTFENCQSPCQTCTISLGNICTSCIDGFTLVQGSCVVQSCPVPYCQACSAGGICLQCLPTFTLVENTCQCQTGFSPSTTSSSNAFCMCTVGVGATASTAPCYFCQVAACQTCSSNGCQACFPGYTLLGNSCILCPLNCINCLGQGVCGNCSTGYSLSLTSTCVLCVNVTSNCGICSADNVCAACSPGFSPFMVNGTIAQCSICNITNCASCNSTNVCYSCSNGYSLSNSACVSNAVIQLNCILPCFNCTATNQCPQCLPYLYSQTPNGRTCYMCSVSNCITCSSSNPSNCTQCASSFILVQGLQGGYCSVSPNYGCSYQNQTTGTCLQCMSYFYMQSNGTCLPCNTSVQGCTACSSNLSTCTACQSGLYLSNGICSMCSYLCATCTNSSCNANPQTIVIGGQGYTSPCYLPCLQCNPALPSSCSYCSSGYFLQNNVCVSCGASCKTCSSSSPSQCLSCFNYQFLNANLACQPCQYPCQTCSGSTNNCTSCVSNYILVNNVCTTYAITSGVNFCASWGINTCSVCLSGYALTNNEISCIGSVTCSSPYDNCSPILPGCLVPTPGDVSQCQLCDQGLFLNVYTNQCVRCPLNCQTCSSDLVCSSCFSGYYLTGNSMTPCAPNCLYPCSTCSYNNASFCLSCVAGYTFSPLSPNQCSPSTQCNPCFVCPGGYGLNQFGNCSLCLSNLNCLSCSQTTSLCLSCYSGYYLNSSSGCSQCQSGCATCTSSSTCLSCAKGFYNPLFYQSSVEVISTCLPCGIMCVACQDGPYQCLSCKIGYTLMGTQCISNFNYYFNLTLNTTLTVFNIQYVQFVNTLQAPIEAGITVNNPRLFYPTSIQANTITTVFISGYLSSGCNQGSTCASAEYQRVQSLFSSLVITGMPVASSFVQQSSAPTPSNTTNQTTFNCSSPCLACNTSAGYCTSCPNGYTNMNGNCVSQNCSILYCQSCLSGNPFFCQQCNPSFILVANSACTCQSGWAPSSSNSDAVCVCQLPSCQNCTIPNCLNCSRGPCTACAPTYQLNSQGLCVICNINNCLSCLTPTYCSTCANGYSVSVFGDQCIVCNASNCLYCSAITTCAACSPGYVFDYQMVACVTCNLPNCISCQGNNACYSCAPSYILTSNLTCAFSACLPPCASCNPNGTCLTCDSPPYQLQPGNNSQCYSCNVANCATCSQNSITCNQCQSGYTLINNNTQCSLACMIVGCASCNNAGQCLSCSPKYALSQNTCVPCPGGCTNCVNSNSCIQCSTGFYLSGQTCMICPSYCSSCQSASSCSKPQQSSGQSLVQVDGQTLLASCDQGCKQCSSTNPLSCLQCQNGYYLNTNLSKCLPCSPSSNCMMCNTTNPSACLSCFPNNFLTASNAINICSSCTFPCITCKQDQLSSCLSCPSGYLLQNGTCLSLECPLFCIECLSQFDCLQCVSGYAPLNGLCYPCIMGCSSCSVSSPGICLQCSEGTYLDPISQQCFGCSLGCMSCQQSGCLSCFQGFYLTSNLTCAQDCIYPCATCSQTSPSSCLTCQIGYIFNTSALHNCQPDTSCSSTFSCLSCPFGYILTSQLQCSKCGSNCARCLADSLSTCTSCGMSQYLNGSQCVNCSSNCQSCLSGSVCTKCMVGYVSLNSASANSPVYCAACSFPCATCMSSTTNCLSCAADYSLQNAKCVSNFNFDFNVIFQVNSTQFYQNYPSFISNLSTIVNGDAGFVNIQTINPGSVNVTGFLSTISKPQTSTSNAQYTNLLNSLSVNSNFANMKVITSKVSTNGGSAQTSNSSGTKITTTTIIIIVSVIVPVVALVILGILLWIRKKRRAEKENMEIELGPMDLKAELQ